MADLAFLTTFFVDWQARGIIGDTYDPGFNPDAFKPWCDVQFTPKLIGQDSQEIPIIEQNPKLTLLLLPVPARLESGVLKAVRGAAPATGEDTPTADEYNEQRDSVGVPLTAETAALELHDGVHLVYEVKFGPMKINGGTYQFDDFVFPAPTTATRVHLTTVERLDLPPRPERTELVIQSTNTDFLLDAGTTGKDVVRADTAEEIRELTGALFGVVVDSAGNPVTTKRARIVLDENGEIDDILIEEA
ncbi:hypothetical protein H7J86_26430 [Mycobacterium hackensackense]|uniref:hypothetical protein n=1 Tax=Mycobacterium hackensackense TaxID=228909 RepID=UPI002265DBE8|nr:hypothetical protein [Mycobacterium hackensackense]MCV7255707.1 hypothetical protein [Mycobacterium hackensackense]